MPAVERRFTHPLPAYLYIDTDIFVSYLFSGQSHHERVVAFLLRVQAAASTTIVTSSLTWLELAQVITRANFRHSLTLAERRLFRLGRWELRSVRTAYLAAVMRNLTAMLDQLGWVEIPLDSTIRTLAVEYMARYALGSHDTVHLASARYARVADLASFDEAFRWVDGLQLWSDRVSAS